MTRIVHIGYELNDDIEPVPMKDEMQMGYSVDYWASPPPDHVWFVDAEGNEFFIPRKSIDRFPLVERA
jgi:hypothetical protein